jgi:hypothetical protein
MNLSNDNLIDSIRLIAYCRICNSPISFQLDGLKQRRDFHQKIPVAHSLHNQRRRNHCIRPIANKRLFERQPAIIVEMHETSDNNLDVVVNELQTLLIDGQSASQLAAWLYIEAVCRRTFNRSNCADLTLVSLSKCV